MKSYGSWESDDKDVWEQFYAFSDAYLDSAKRLCKVLIRSTFHSAELFLKASVLKKSPGESLNHDIEHYEKRYRKLYPGKRFQIDIPFRKEYLVMTPQQIELARKSASPREQINRYPADKNKNKWKGIFCFEPISFMGDIENMELSFKKAKREIKHG